MEKLRLGRTDLNVSKLGFGGIPIQRLSEDAAVAVVRRCIDLGITFIDTANGYGKSEEYIGKAISGNREKVILATKSMDRTREGLEAHLKLSIKRLGVEYIDLYQFHNVADSESLNKILAPNGPFSTVKEAKKAGIVKHIGVSSHSMDMAKKLVKSDLFETIMFPFNFVTCEAIDELLPLTREHDVGFIAMKPLAGGMLDNISLTFKYLFQFPDVIPIPGIGDVREIEEIVQILEGPHEMTAAEQEEMERKRLELGKIFCRRCEYCRPCPEEIPIPMVLDIYGIAKGCSPEQLFFGRFAEMLERAAKCTQCRECEERCPYKLPIHEMIEERVAWYYMEKEKYQKQIET